jgi:hypothetical protein
MSRKIWTPQEIEFLKANYANTLTSELCKIMNRSERSIYSQAGLLGIKKSEEIRKLFYWTKEKHHGKGLFKKGHVPANKGKKMTKEVYEKSKHTFYKKGHKPKNTLYDGALTIRKDKNGRVYVFIRISEGVWKLLHQVIWEKIKGPIPKGYNVVFKDKNQFNFNLDNLECISNSELLERNTIHRWPIELKKLIRINSKLKKEIYNQLNSQK